MKDNYLVTKSNYLIMNSNYDLSIEEQKIILTLASMVQITDKDFKEYQFKISEFMELIGVENKSYYTQVPKITKELMKKVFEIEEPNGDILQVAWLSGARYKKGSGMVHLTFNPWLKPYMIQLKDHFTKYKLSNILNMKSKYSPRVYEILKCNEFKKQGYLEIEIDTLRKLLKADTIYPLYADFKRKVILVTELELNLHSDLQFTFEEIKTGRKITSIKFLINKNKVKNEIAVTSMEVEEEPKELELVKIVQAIFTKHSITDHEVKCILKDANNNIDLIKQCYEYCLEKNIDNVVGYMRRLVKGFNKPLGNIKTSTFNDYEQRTYDFDELEKKLLAWKNNE